MKKALNVLKAQQAWRLIESADALLHARKQQDAAEQQLNDAKNIRNGINEALARHSSPALPLNPAALRWVGADLQKQGSVVDTAAHAAMEATQAHDARRQEVAHLRFGEKKLEEKILGLRKLDRAEQEKHNLNQLDELWLQGLHQKSQVSESPQ